MKSGSVNPQKKQNTIVPPRRGQIKAQIFKSLIETVSSVGSKAGEPLSKLDGKGNGVGSPESATPPPSGHTSDGSPDHA